MSFSNDTGATASTSPNLGNMAGDYFKQHFPLASGVAHMVIGNHQPASNTSNDEAVNPPNMPDMSVTNSNQAQPINLPQQQLPDYSSMGEPKKSGGHGLGTILKLMTGI